ncbi:MAG: sigma 54-interacting transcriptional regulator [Thermodesulfobacteriota bacterium]
MGGDDGFCRAVVETMAEGLLHVDPRGRIMGLNRAFEEMTGYSAADLVGKNCTVLNCTGCDVFGEKPAEGGHWCALFRDHGVRRRSCEIRDAEGGVVYVEKQASVLYDAEGNCLGAAELFTDMTPVVRQRERIRALEASMGLGEGGHYGILGASPQVESLLDLIESVAQSEAPVFIHGESGVGKELAALAIHRAGPRAGGPFIRVNCASLNENLLESELFGHVKGAFTGADRARVGRFEAARGGSLFLDEIGDVSPAIQVKLLRVLESGEIERVGDHRPVPVDARIITATNRGIESMVERGAFRQDLYYRINVVPVYVPPLRDRREDIPLLAEAFVHRVRSKSKKAISGFTPRAMEALMAHDWPGNIRELANAVEYAFVLCRSGAIDLPDLPPRVAGGARSRPAASSPAGDERQELAAALEKAGGNRSLAAEMLGISRVTVWKRMKKYGLQ